MAGGTRVKPAAYVLLRPVGTGPTATAYSKAGNMTTIPQSSDPTKSYTATYDAWNRLVKLVDDDTTNTVSEYEYDGAKRRNIQKTYVGGSLDETRHLYYTDPSKWQVIEERVDSSSDPEQQHVWGLRYIDDVVLRDRDTTGNGALDERLYGMQDANWNVTALSDASAIVRERFAYSGYGTPMCLTSSFIENSSTLCWTILYAGGIFETQSELIHIRNRSLQSQLGVWIQRDPIPPLLQISAYDYCDSRPLDHSDPSGLFAVNPVLVNPATISLCMASPPCAIALGVVVGVGLSY